MERGQYLEGTDLPFNHILPFISSVTLGHLFSFYEPRFPHLQNADYLYITLSSCEHRKYINV